ncbi:MULTISPECIES: general stress protein [Pantoea]|uniref:general stress protein n=1 Tax=Pantoea TaxID=53335 RepID=UPI00257FA5EB|nr:general stress protein [Pantoea sp. UBA5960]
MTQHRGGSGNFADDKQRASEAGKKGGQHSGGSFSNDREKASDADKKGSQSGNRGA